MSVFDATQPKVLDAVVAAKKKQRVLSAGSVMRVGRSGFGSWSRLAAQPRFLEAALRHSRISS